MQTLFENKARLNKKDIMFQGLFVIAFFILIYFVGPVLRPNVKINENLDIFFLIGLGFLLGLILFKSFREQTIIRIDIEEEKENKLRIVVQRQFKGYTTITFNADLKYRIETVPSRSIPPIKNLVLSDGKRLLKITNRYKGIDTKTLETIFTNLKKHYP